jgi:hypothetical protein
MARAPATRAADRSEAWVTFAGIILTLAGVLDILNGAWALATSNTAIDSLIFRNDAEAWGWFYIAVGAVIAAVGIGVFSRASWAILAGILISMLGAVANMFWAFAFPVVSVVMVTLHVLVIWALVVYAGGDEEVTPPPL